MISGEVNQETEITGTGRVLEFAGILNAGHQARNPGTKNWKYSNYKNG